MRISRVVKTAKCARASFCFCFFRGDGCRYDERLVLVIGSAKTPARSSHLVLIETVDFDKNTWFSLEILGFLVEHLVLTGTWTSSMHVPTCRTECMRHVHIGRESGLPDSR